MKIFSPEQVKQWDQQTLIRQQISSHVLMLRAGKALAERLLEKISHDQKIWVFCGPGNNGGDGWVVANELKIKGYEVFVVTALWHTTYSPDNLHFRELYNSDLHHIQLESFDQQIGISKHDVIVDALFGQGLSRPLEGKDKTLVDWIHSKGTTIISLDIASGLLSHKPMENDANAIQPQCTLTIQSPKLAFFIQENAHWVGEWEIVDIQLDEQFYELESTPFRYTTSLDVKKWIPHRSVYAHKGHFGHLGVWAGSLGKMGANVLACIGALRSGVGLLTAFSPSCGVTILQTALPDAMVVCDEGEEMMVTGSWDLQAYTALVAGPGIGQHPKTGQAFKNMLQKYQKPMVIDADGLNLVAKNPELWDCIPKGSVLTPHAKELERLIGICASTWEKWEKVRSLAKKYEVIFVLKGPNTAVVTPEGAIHFNSSGNPGMAKAGMGDVLAGVIGSLLAQKYNPIQAAIIGVYLHGKSADEIKKTKGEYSILASDVAQGMGNAFLSLL